MAGSPGASSTSGAPSSQADSVPSPSVKAAPLYLRADEKGMVRVTSQPEPSG